MAELLFISTLNGVLFGLLLFLMASGLTLIFSMMGVLNFAHASFYMLGAFIGFQISKWAGFWVALILAPVLVGLAGAMVEKFGLRNVHRHGHVAELLFTFGLAFVIEEVVQIIWGKSPVDFRVPALLDFPAFTVFATNYPAYKLFMLVISIAIFAGLFVMLTKTRIGLIVQAALTHPNMVAHLGHNVPLIFMSVFGVGAALAGIAGVIAGPALVTQASMAALLGPILFVVVVVGGLGSLPGAFIASLLIGLLQTFAVSVNLSLADVFAFLNFTPAPGSTLGDLWKVTIAQIAPIMPYLLLVLILVFKPTGLLGDARHMTDDVIKAPVTSMPASAHAGGQARAGLVAALYRNWPWIAVALVLAVLPALFRSGTSLTLMSLMGIAIIFALSYNMLLGQTGMLSFGHAVYYGLGAYLAVHGMNAVIAGRWLVPLPLIPIVGGLTGLFFGALFGWVSTKRSGTAFAMISLGLAELVGSSALILRGFFGGEEGVTTNRTKLFRLFDWSFGPQIQVYYLIAAWCLLCMFLMYRITRTPFGRMCNAVRDNAERAQFVGYNPQVVRYISFCLSGLFAGVAGALAACNFEIANAAYFAASQSGIVLLAVFIGGAGFFIGPVIGAALVSYLQVMLSDLTEIWQLYFGLLFIGMVMFAPFGIAGLLMMHRQLVRRGTLMQVLPTYLVILVPGLLIVTGIVMVIELLFRLSAKSGEELAMHPFGLTLQADHLAPWLAALAMTAVGTLLFRLTWPIVASAWARATANQTGALDA